MFLKKKVSIVNIITSNLRERERERERERRKRKRRLALIGISRVFRITSR